jgi:hypothetical protein
MYFRVDSDVACDIIMYKHAYIVVQRDNNRLGRPAKNREQNLSYDRMVLNLTGAILCIIIYDNKSI